MSKIKAIVLFTLVMVAGSSCGSGDEKAHEMSGGKQFEGWAGPPEQPNAKPFEFFYMKSTGRASQKAMDKRSGAMMQTTCTDAATTKVKGDLIGKLVKESIEGASGVADGESTGVVVVREFGGTLGGVNVKECKNLYPDDPNIPYSGWKECECIVYIKVPGGRDAVVAKATSYETGKK
ncbi:MAG: lipoprotein LipL21 [Leptospiraceae bacterium]|nr:lipoprotein LipL21 [Leptospiraceae bacterium]